MVLVRAIHEPKGQGMPEPEHAGTITITIESDETAHVVRVAGELDLNSRIELEAVLAGLSKPPQIVVLEFSDLTFVDSTGLKSLLNEHRKARAEKYEFAIAGAHGAVREVFRITALDITLPLVPDVASVVGD
jgi:anti-sigma B factor antagonist